MIERSSSKGPGKRPGPSFIVGLITALVLGGCSTNESISCPRQFDPGGLADAQLKNLEFGRIPDRGATTRESVTKTIQLRRNWIERNYRGVEALEVGEGWGVTYSRDELGNITFHREPDHIIVTTVTERSDCPDPEKGTLLIFNSEKQRVPVRFEYRAS